MTVNHAVLHAAALICCAGAAIAASGAQGQPAAATTTPWIVAHRGASAYAPENTVPAFRLAADQGATFVEFDVQWTKDRQIVCLHDTTLERTTDVEEVFPDRFRTIGSGPQAKKQWALEDFTLAELRRLDAGTWFNPSFRGTRIPTFGETIDALRGRSGLFIELKAPERYPGIEAMILAELKAKGLDRPGADARTPVLLQSFNQASLESLKKSGTALPIHFLLSARDAAPWVTPDGLAKMKAFATGFSPEKSIVMNHREAIAKMRAEGLPVTPYTFRASAVVGFPDVKAEMAHYLNVLGVDGVITDNPDQRPTRSRIPNP
jgi:glycerophosphoryl diester phosphodiesterase